MTNDHIYYISRLMVKSIKYPMTNDHMSSFTRISTNSFLLDSDLQSTDDRYNQDQYKSEVLLFHVHDTLRIYYE